MFSRLKEHVNVKETQPDEFATDENSNDAIVMSLIDEMPDQDPAIAKYDRLIAEKRQLQALSAALRTSNDPRSLLQFANYGGGLEAALPSVVALEGLTPETAAARADEIDAFILSTVDPAIEETGLAGGRGFLSKLFGIGSLLATIAGIVTIFSGVKLAIIIGVIGAATSAASIIFDKDRPRKAPDANMLRNMSAAIDKAWGSLTSLVGMKLPTQQAEVEGFRKAVIQHAKALTGVGITVSEDGSIVVAEFPEDKKGTGKDLGYDNKATLDGLKSGLQTLRQNGKTKITAIEGGLKRIGTEAERILTGKKADEAAAIKQALLTHRRIVQAGLRRQAKAIVYVANGTNRGIKAFYRLKKEDRS